MKTSKRFLKINDHVRLYDYPYDHVNASARINIIDETNDRIFLTNMNMPYLGTINGWYSKEEFLRMTSQQ